ncbi:MAG: DoxX family protein [Armatimonadota bacterium]|nr:DoxX family protein [Armatimonadota bacterium]MDR7518029.1 DoxX family protein [Armatimonadota bacterium]
MFESIFAPVQDWGLLILRLGLGIIFPFHAWLKANPRGPAGGVRGFSGWLAQMRVPLPGFLGWVVVLLESVGAVLLILGLGTRLLALGFAIEMLVAILLVKRGMAKKRFMEPDGTGWEFEFALMMAALALVFAGPGSIALDRVIGL